MLTYIEHEAPRVSCSYYLAVMLDAGRVDLHVVDDAGVSVARLDGAADVNRVVDWVCFIHEHYTNPTNVVMVIPALFVRDGACDMDLMEALQLCDLQPDIYRWRTLNNDGSWMETDKRGFWLGSKTRPIIVQAAMQAGAPADWEMNHVIVYGLAHFVRQQIIDEG